MPEEISFETYHSDEVHDIVTAVPSWILRWGITLIFSILFGIILLSSLIEYPDVVKTSLKVNSLNSPKSIISKQNGRLTALLIDDGQYVRKNQLLGYFETTGNLDDILILNNLLKAFQAKFNEDNEYELKLPRSLNLGDLQSSYQSFYQQYLIYQATKKNGYYENRISFLERDLRDIKALRAQIFKQEEIQKLEYANKENEYKTYQKLFKNKVISRSEFIEQENKFLASKYPLQQSETAVLNNASSFSAKEKELLEIRHIITEEQSKFLQALNRCANECDAWLLQNVLRAPIDGKLSYAGILQQNQNLSLNQEVFIINPGNTTFFGEIKIPQYNMGKVRIGQRTLIKLHSYPYEQYGVVRGELSSISDVAFRDSVFIAQVAFKHFENKNERSKVNLKNGMIADAEIITEESSLLQRFFRGITKMTERH